MKRRDWRVWVVKNGSVISGRDAFSVTVFAYDKAEASQLAECGYFHPSPTGREFFGWRTIAVDDDF